MDYLGLQFANASLKRSEVAVFNVLPEWLPVVAKPQALYIGGPLNPPAVCTA